MSYFTQVDVVFIEILLYILCFESDIRIFFGHATLTPKDLCTKTIQFFLLILLILFYCLVNYNLFTYLLIIEILKRISEITKDLELYHTSFIILHLILTIENRTFPRHNFRYRYLSTSKSTYDILRSISCSQCIKFAL